MSFGLQNSVVHKTPTGRVDSAFPAGNDGSDVQPSFNLTGLPGLGALLIGDTFSLDLISHGFFSDPGSPASELGFYTVSGTPAAAAGFVFASGVLSNALTLANFGVFRLVAIRKGISVLSAPIFYSISAAAGIDNVAPTIPTGISVAPGISLNSIDFSFDPPCDVAPAGTAASGTAHVDLLVNGVVASPPTPMVTSPNALGSPNGINIGAINSPDIPAFVQNGKAWTLSAAGTGIAGTTSEQCLFVDFGTFGGVRKFVAKIDAYASSAATALAGIMAHETAAAGGKFVAIGLRPSNGTVALVVESRNSNGGTSTQSFILTQDANNQPLIGPVYVSFDRASDNSTWKVSYSLNEKNWVIVGNVTNAMNAAVHYGLFATSQSAGTDVTVTIEEVAITNTGRLSGTVSASSAVQMQLRSVDVAGNQSALSTIIQGLPNLGSGGTFQTLYASGYGCQFDNQFYSVGSGVQRTQFLAKIGALGSDSKTQFIEIYFTWGNAEGATQGDYSISDTAISEMLTTLAAQPQKMYLIIKMWGARTFDGSNSTSYFPQYAKNNGWVIPIPAATGFNGYMGTWQNPAMVAAYTAAVTHICDKWGNHPNFFALSPTDESDMVTNYPGVVTDTQWYAVFKQMCLNVKAHLPNRFMWMPGNWMPPGGALETTRFVDLVSTLNTQYPGGIAYGGPDYVERNTNFQKFFRGEIGTLGDLRGKYMWIQNLEETGIGGSPGPTILYLPSAQIAQSVLMTGAGATGGQGAYIWLGNNTNAYTYKWSSGAPTTDQLTAIHNGPFPLQSAPPSIGSYIQG